MSTAIPIIKGMSVLLLVADLEQSIAFYSEHLGFEIDFRYEDFYAGIVRGPYSIHLKCGKPDLRERENRLLNEDLDLVFAVTELLKLYEAMKNGPVTIVQALREMPYGVEFYISDPDGYVIAFVE
jgi:catechol 2,3-dioxygenase-like lactoylglutathione lyase family enzyme